MSEKSKNCPKAEKLSNILDSSLPSLYLSGSKWYFKTYKGDKRISVSTGESDRKRAEEWEKRYFLQEEKETSPRRLAPLLKLFSSADTNPKYLDAEITGGHYTKRYADFEAARVGHLMTLLPAGMLEKKLNDLNRGDVDTVRRILSREYGTRPVANDTFKTFKSILNWAYSKGFMREMIAFRVGGMKIEKQKDTDYLPFSSCLRIAREGGFRTDKERDVFTVLLLTGMRRAELAAIQGKQLRKARIGQREFWVLDISQSWKDGRYSELGRPKWDIQRIIPLCEEAGEILSRYKKGDNDFLLPIVNSTWTDMFTYIRGHSPLLPSTALNCLTPHKLRHALNTMLVEEDVNPTLIQEYLAWYHQDRNKVQSGYTHIYIKALLTVVDKIEERTRGDVGEEGEDALVWLE